MTEAEVIPIGSGGRPGRGSRRRATPSAAARSLAPATPAARAKKATTAAATGGRAAPADTARTPRSAEPRRPRPPRPRAVSDAVGADTPQVPPAPPAPPPGPAPGQRRAALSRTTTSPLEEVARLLGEAAAAALGADGERRLAEALAFLRRRLTGDYEVDLYGFDAELTETVLMPALRPLYRRWFRVEVRGLGNVPSEGGALVVANHSGTVPIDSLMTQLALLDEHPARRHLRMLGADLVYSTPFVGQVARTTGGTLACTEDAEGLLSAGEVVGVWPEGFKGVGKPFRERYKLQRFGRGGFVSAALRTQVPIVPCSIVGAEEIYPLIGDVPTLARLLGVPYIPITPTFPWLGLLGLIPLPSKWIIEFGEPIPTDSLGEGAADDPMLVFNVTDQVRETIQHTLYSLLMRRRSVFF